MTGALAFAEAILTLRLRFPFSVTSWGRTPKRNQDIGGVSGSLHLTWQAVDVALDDPAQKLELLAAAERLGLKVVDEPHHLHLQTP